MLSEAEEQKRSVLEELRKTREELKAERDKWHQESETLKQVTHVHVQNIAWYLPQGTLYIADCSVIVSSQLTCKTWQSYYLLTRYVVGMELECGLLTKNADQALSGVWTVSCVYISGKFKP